eukprot:TRINITY_DN2082_c0_g3_i1.p1 TRINITY_DN2082_c0_g3~~TRINITY_DN2082_c0_g3_i1.p1  ORF type:complete len:153 (+),score=40.34 TRINITY_DN2082_c0_g3_i1:199-657(+)
MVLMKLFDSQIPIIVTLLSASLDFWINKNVSGRVLVGLRWWSEFKDDGQEIWVFECKVDESKNNAIDSNIFWGSQIVFTIAWVAIIISNIMTFGFFKISINAFVLVMVVTNLLAYYRCSRAQQDRVKKYVTKKATEAAVQAAKNQIMKGSPI